MITAFIVAYFVVLAALFAYGVNGYVLMLWSRRAQEPTPGPREHWPHVCVQIPIYNERDVVARVIHAAGALRYRGRLDIQVLDDSTDDTPMFVRNAIADLAGDNITIDHVRRRNREGFKAGALAHGMTLTEAELFLILDADFVPQPDMLERMVPLLDGDDIACVQSRWGHINRDHSAFTRAQALGIDVHFFIEQPARAAASWSVSFNGTGGLWRRAALEDGGGWSADTLTEDLDLSYRVWLRGWTIRYTEHTVCPAEIPETMLPFKAQQRRWACGSTATARKLLGPIWRAPVSLGAKLQATLHLTHYAVHPLILLSAVSAIPLGLLASPGASLWTVLPPLAMATGGPVGMAWLAGKRAGIPWRQRLRDVGSIMLLGTGVALSNSVAVFQGLRSRRRAFVRTPKGGAASSYRVADDRLGSAELGFAVGCLAIAGWLAERGIFTMVPFLLLYAAGLGRVGLASLWETRQNRTEVVPVVEEA